MALLCKETRLEPALVYRSIKNVEDNSRVLLPIGKISTFSELLKRAANITNDIKKSGTSIWF